MRAKKKEKKALKQSSRCMSGSPSVQLNSGTCIRVRDPHHCLHLFRSSTNTARVMFCVCPSVVFGCLGAVRQPAAMAVLSEWSNTPTLWFPQHWAKTDWRPLEADGPSLSYNWPVQWQFTLQHLSKYANCTVEPAKTLPTVVLSCQHSLTTYRYTCTASPEKPASWTTATFRWPFGVDKIFSCKSSLLLFILL